MITNLPIEPDTSMEDQCGTCNKCIDVCPTGALVQGGQLNAQRCIAFQTQTKGFLAEEFREKLGNRIYGCDTCQTVCPKNKGIDFHNHPEMEPDPEIAKPLLQPLLLSVIKNLKKNMVIFLVHGVGRSRSSVMRLLHLLILKKKEQSVI